ncbi:bifunctional riboflavin kinase/FAD synthetase [Heyndrickxia ginsengihumi]|uniref:Riboflavin biosynthesis protein n=1 Tax=Heyndrickxia ginsengihumi TaxID=363870 RepID=A0A0A6VE26_9BACI|nr:bifunctional riboflavin kinase/FAD synthetase [Heyndrickxia ginsengihumi]KHD86540.1 riboflavin biosynthesis protein RibF [Heyndrickxia ginsengihumi]MBE6182798.1 bifunctional riboflavin kinase/FAD synthetase [Bacillus sp. (in: firmicutes)]MCM3022538.1 bifunctional riboflavin kinase/FAD synthetase [Heyndrickxia ginsengihumi]NEY19658.1 bifunctional riboflavin kinase/FAD synthetase [Heyndrickxia ginsengihumi]
MKVLTVDHPHSFKKEDFPPLVMALGYFDGIHLGHQKVIQTAKQIAEEKHLKSAVMTFDPHPSVVLAKNHKVVELITPLHEKIKLIESMGIDYLFVVHFTTDFASLLPQQFVDQYIVGLGVKHVVAGFDYTYGKFGKGNMNNIEEFANGRFDITVVDKLTLQNRDDKVSSTLIRKCIKEGRVRDLKDLLGRYYEISGIVVHGEKRGRELGFPTANIELSDPYILPPNGVYIVRMYVRNQWHNGLCSVGYNPTFKNPDEYVQTTEVYLLDFSDWIYDEHVIVEWHDRIRDEKKFNSVEDLITEMKHDEQVARNYFK